MKLDQPKLIQDLQAAKEAALKTARDNPGDGGTCNMDRAILFLPKGVRVAQVAGAVTRAGLSGHGSTWLGARVYFIHAPIGGQGDLNTRQAEAISWTLKTAGWGAAVYYQMD